MLDTRFSIHPPTHEADPGAEFFPLQRAPNIEDRASSIEDPEKLYRCSIQPRFALASSSDD
jgi:hypothetical protein